MAYWNTLSKPSSMGNPVAEAMKEQRCQSINQSIVPNSMQLPFINAPSHSSKLLLLLCITIVSAVAPTTNFFSASFGQLKSIYWSLCLYWMLLHNQFTTIYVNISSIFFRNEQGNSMAFRWKQHVQTYVLRRVRHIPMCISLVYVSTARKNSSLTRQWAHTSLFSLR